MVNSHLTMLDFFAPFAAIALAELGDKSQLSIFLLSTRTKRHFLLLLGVMCGFALVDGVAIFAGAAVVKVIPAMWLTIGSGALFIVLGLLMLFQKNDDDNVEIESSKSPFILGFSAIGLAEWGDKTQFGSALFAIEYNPYLVFAGVMCALLILSVLALVAGKFLASKVKPSITKKIAGVIFVALGVSALMF